MNGGNNAICEWFVNGVSVGTGNNYTASLFANNDTLICVADVTPSCTVAGGIVMDTVILRVNPVRQPTLTITANSIAYCSGSTAVFTSSLLDGGTAPFYQWRVNGINVATGSTFSSTTLKNGDLVNCEYSDSTICMSTQTIHSNTIQVQVTTTEIPAIDISTPSTTICSGASVLFNANVQNAGAMLTYQWKINGSNVANNSTTFSSASLVNGDSITCVITIDPLFTCVTTTVVVSDTIIMLVKDGAPPSISITSSANDVCAGTNISFNATVSQAGTRPAYQWTLNGANVGSNLPNYSNSKLKNGDLVQCIIHPGQDACSLADVSALPVTMIIRDTPVIRLSPAESTLKNMEQLQFHTTVTGVVSSFQWTPAGLLQNAQQLNPTTQPLTTDTRFTLTVTNTSGCSSSASAVVKITRPLTVMPNAFTPNGDGKNDVFRIPPGYSIELTEFSVFDRWGYMIFTTKDVGKGWDGTSNGKKSPSGTYVFFIKGVYEGKPVFIKDNIVLVR